MKAFARRLFRPTGWPMATKLLVTFGLIALLPLVVVGRYGYTVARQTVLEAQVRALTSHATNLAWHLDLLLAERQRNIRQLAEDSAVRTFSAAWPEVRPEIQAAVQEDLDNLIQANPYFHLARLLDRDGRVILSTADEIGADYSFRPYFQQALAGNAAISDLSISVGSGQPAIYFSAPVRDQAGQVVAVAVLRVLAEEIWSLVEQEKDMLGAGSVAILFDEYGLRLAHTSDRSLIFKAVVPLDPQVEAQLLTERRLGTMKRIEATDFPELAEGIRRAESQPYFTHRMAIRDELFHAGAARMTIKPWTVIETVPESAFLASVSRLDWTIGLAVGAVVLLSLLVTVLATQWVVNPVRELTATAHWLAGGELDRPVDGFQVQREDEIGLLLQSFEAMRVGLQDSYVELEARSRRLRRLYELAMALSGDVSEIADRVVSIVAELLDVKVATVEEIHQDKIVILSMYDHGQISNEGEFPLRGTPCENVREEKTVCHYTGAMEDFPGDAFLAGHGLTTYLGVPILDGQGEVLGVINAMDDRERDFDEEDIHLLQTLAKRISVEIEQARVEAELRRRAGELEAIAEVGGLVTAGGDLQITLDTLAEKIAEAADFDGVGIGLYNAEKEEISFPALFTTRRMKWLEGRKGTTVHLKEVPVLQQLLREKCHILFDDPQNDPRVREGQRALAREDGIQVVFTWPLLYAGKLIGTLDLFSTRQRSFSPEDLSLLSTLADQTATAVRNARLFAETRQRLREISLLFDLSAALRSWLRMDAMLPIILDHTRTGLNADGRSILTFEPRSGTLQVQDARGECESLTGQTHPLEAMPAACALRTGGPCLGQEDCPFFPNAGRPRQVACAPFKVGGRILGMLNVGSRSPEAFGEDDLRLLSGIADLAANALRRAALFEEVRLYKDAFDSAADAVAITDLDSHILDVNPAFEQITGFAREEALGQKPSLLKSHHSTPEFYRAMWDQILSQGHWTGEIINRRKDGGEWDSFLTISTVKDEDGQPVAYVGINRDITELKNLQRELEDSYMTTIEALAAALDARDRETEGHSRRVTQMALRIAEAMGLNELEREALRCGALLHDVGKIGISDAILHKPGELTLEEWDVMKQHPAIGYRMLQGVKFLQDALPVVFCHHEKWNGDGYPQGLAGEAIPLVARIFAVADAYDAMTSDRPYRKALSHEEALAEIEQCAGTHFDPAVVTMFVQLYRQS